MAPMQPPRGDYTATADELKKIDLPASFYCKDCGRDKAPSTFSKKWHSDYRFFKHNNANYKVTRANSKMRCRKCTGEQLHELKCKGHCGLWKSLDEFSKRQRGNGENWCKECIDWKLSLEPGTSTWAGPGHDIAPDEEILETTETTETSTDKVESYEDEDQWEYGYEDDEAPPAGDIWAWGEECQLENSMATLSVNQTETDVASAFVPATPATSSSLYTNPSTGGYVPPHLRGASSAAVSPAPSATLSAPCTNPTTSEYVPPHMRVSSAHSLDIASGSSVSNSYEEGREFSSGASTVGEPIEFNAYDPQGNAHTLQRMPSGSTQLSSPAVAGSGVTAGRAPTVRPSVAPTAPLVTRGNGWAKPTGNKSKPERFVPKKLATRRPNNGDDSDESGPDEM